MDLVQWCKQDGVQMLTAYAFSTENWSRDPLEVQTLMAIFAKYAESFKTEALSHNVKVNVFSTGKWVRVCSLLYSTVLWLILLQTYLYHCWHCIINVCRCCEATG